MIVIKRPLGLLLLFSTALLSAVTYASAKDKKMEEKNASLGSIYFSMLSNAQVGHYLGWVSDEEDVGYCGGYFVEQPIRYRFELPNNLSENDLAGTPIEQTPIQITALEGDLLLKGKSVLSGNVEVTQFNRQLTADSAAIYRNDHGDITQIDLEGSVRMHQPEKLVIANKATVPLENSKVHDLTLSDVIYRVSLDGITTESPVSRPCEVEKEPTKSTQLMGWGRAKEVKEESPEVLSLKKASYSTCPPTDKSCAWHITAYQLVLDKESERGKAYASTLWIKKMPVMFLPYFSFPLDNQRKSGFLYPNFMDSSNNGFSLSIPYYADLAPNYDLTLTPHYYSERGLFLDSQWRYLTRSTSGSFDFGVAPDDKKFDDFQQSAQTSYAGRPELSDLEDSSTTRQGLHWLNYTNFNKQWSSNIDYNYVSDDYYTQDFSQSFNQDANYQLLQQGDIKYYGTHWMFQGLMKNYQTLHPVDQDTINNQYARLPELNLNADYPDQLSNADLTWRSQFDYFYMDENPGETTEPVIGSRINLQPGISMPFRQSYGYITPTVELSTTAYQLENEGENNPNNPSRVLPLLDIDSGLYFDRDAHLMGHHYTQTLEPRLYYLYVPYQDQDDLPDFDSILNTLNYDRLFQHNRFSSVDRIGDANQFSLGLTSRLFDQDSGDEKLRVSVGDAWYLHDRQVNLCTSSTCEEQDTEEFSPVASTVNYWLTKQWSVNSDAAYDFNQTMFDNGTVTVGYAKDKRRVINFGYSYSTQGDIYTDNTDDSDLYNLSQLHASYAWPINQQWNSLGSVDVSPSYGNGISYLLGAEYDACCWGVKFFMSQQIVGVDNGDYQYDRTYYVQLVLKGMGSLNSRNANDLVQKNIDNYNDDFVRVF